MPQRSACFSLLNAEIKSMHHHCPTCIEHFREQVNQSSSKYISDKLMTGHLCEFFYFLFFKLSFPYCILPCVFQTSHHNAPHDQPVFILCRFHSFKLRLQISFPYSPSSSPPEQRLQCFLVEIYAHTYSFDKSESSLEHVSS